MIYYFYNDITILTSLGDARGGTAGGAERPKNIETNEKTIYMRRDSRGC